MKKIIPILLILILVLLLVNAFSFDPATSVVPGWHTTILPPYFLVSVVFTILLLIDIPIYLYCSKKDLSNVRNFIIAHSIISFLLLILLRFTEIYFDNLINQKDTEIMNSITIIELSIKGFTFLQLVYFVYILSLFRKNKSLL